MLRNAESFSTFVSTVTSIFAFLYKMYISKPVIIHELVQIIIDYNNVIRGIDAMFIINYCKIIFYL